MQSSAGAEPQGLPPWEQRYPGRMAAEIAGLEEVGARPLVREEALERGVLEVDLIWRVGANEVKLFAQYPDSFPRMRPNVSLSEDPAKFPERHCNPVDGNLCLLGRDTAQWLPSWTLARLLEEQLEDALRGTGDEDPQAEPAEVWWNTFGLMDSYVLVDSSWDVADAREGSLTIRYVANGGQSPQVQGAVTEVRDKSRTTIAEWSEALPEHLRRGRTLAVPWMRVDGTFLPRGRDVPNLQDILKQHPRLSRPTELASGLYGFMFGLIYSIEVAQGQEGIGWLLGLVHGPRKAFGPRATRPQQFNTVPTMRAGRQDTGSRVPAVEILRTKTIALFGTGALGAPLALELARNGCKELRLLDSDIVEPGNTIRWPLGSTAWGRKKVEVLHEFIRANYPQSTTVPVLHGLGKNAGDDAVFDKMMEGADIVVDATASFGATTLIYDYASERGLPLVSVWATPPLHGGVVARYVPGAGCPVCLEHHYHDGTLQPPDGLGQEADLVQPPGCAERTFTGASFDLQELSIEAVRLILDTVSQEADQSYIETLTLVSEGSRSLPTWKADRLEKHPSCRCP